MRELLPTLWEPESESAGPFPGTVVPTLGHTTLSLGGPMKTHKPGPIPRCLIHWAHSEGGEFALLGLGGVYSGASWRRFSGQDAKPPSFAWKLVAVDNSVYMEGNTLTSPSCQADSFLVHHLQERQKGLGAKVRKQRTVQTKLREPITKTAASGQQDRLPPAQLKPIPSSSHFCEFPRASSFAKKASRFLFTGC